MARRKMDRPLLVVRIWNWSVNQSPLVVVLLVVAVVVSSACHECAAGGGGRPAQAVLFVDASKSL